jgi:hypothetical protein
MSNKVIRMSKVQAEEPDEVAPLNPVEEEALAS